MPGLIVYNTNASAMNTGYYYFDGLQWLPFSSENGIIQETVYDISTVTLGYIPWGTAEQAPETMRYDDVYISKVKCIRYHPFEYHDEHSYCAFDLRDAQGNPKGVNWNDSFKIAKSMGGYLATPTSNDEWEAIRTGLLNISSTHPGHLNEHIAWLGFNKVTYPGNPTEFSWITGEMSMVDWGNTSQFQFHFLQNEPNNKNGVEGCVHVLHYGDNRSGAGAADNRLWNDIGCTRIDDTAGDATKRKAAYLLVEFQK